MAQNITLLGASYSAVPAVTLPKTGGGTASFTDVSDTTATADDVASGTYFYTAAGVRTQGTSSGGGGITPTGTINITLNGTVNVTDYAYADVNVSGGAHSSYTLVHSEDVAVSTTSTTGTSVKSITVSAISSYPTKYVYVRIRDKAGKRNGYFYGTDTFFAPTPSSVNSGWGGRALYRCESGGNVTTYLTSSAAGTTGGIGVYPYSYNRDTGAISIYSKYGSTSSLTINGTYTVEIYLLDFPGGVSPIA